MTPVIQAPTVKIKPKPGIGPVKRIQRKARLITHARLIQEQANG